MVLLLDECDSFVSRRQLGNMEQNAVVAAFLRTLEYFKGLLFMTTNAPESVDDAILSRCIAVISYGIPSDDDARKIWNVLSNQFGSPLDKVLVNQLVEHFPNATGRDIKELLKLTFRYCKASSSPIDLHAFVNMAQFKGL